ncbi:MAG: ABC-three component system middle component 6 [Pseudomonadota bacterium]
MLIPTSYENLQKNTLIIGADIIRLLKQKDYNIEALFNELKKLKSTHLNQFYNTLLFLWLADIIELNEHTIILKQK